MTTAPSAANAANGAQFKEALASKTANRSFRDTLSAAPRKARAYLASAIKTLHLDGAASALGDVWSYLLGKAAVAGRFIKGFGFTNLVGLVLTTPLRRYIVPVLSKAYRVVTAPVRWVCRAFAWGLNKFGWGRKVTAKVTETVTKVETFVARKANEGIAFLTKHDSHGAVAWLRWYFQATLVRKGLRMAFPRVPGWVVYAVGLGIPVYGDKSRVAAANEDMAIAKAKVVLADKAADPKVEAKDTMVTKTIVLTDTERPEGDRTFEAVAFTDDQGALRIRLGSQLLLVEDLPDTISVVGEVAGTGDQILVPPVVKIEQTVRAAQANPAGKPPNLPRAASRASQAKRKKAASR